MQANKEKLMSQFKSVILKTI